MRVIKQLLKEMRKIFCKKLKRQVDIQYVQMTSPFREVILAGQFNAHFLFLVQVITILGKVNMANLPKTPLATR